MARGHSSMFPKHPRTRHDTVGKLPGICEEAGKRAPRGAVFVIRPPQCGRRRYARRQAVLSRRQGAAGP